jgi:hypothetical protein
VKKYIVYGYQRTNYSVEVEANNKTDARQEAENTDKWEKEIEGDGDETIYIGNIEEVKE